MDVKKEFTLMEVTVEDCLVQRTMGIDVKSPYIQPTSENIQVYIGQQRANASP